MTWAAIFVGSAVLGLAPPPPPPTSAPPPPDAAARSEGPAPDRFSPASCRAAAPPRALAHPLRSLHGAALRRLPLDADTGRRWQRRVRASAAMPDVSAGWDYRLDQGYGVDFAPGAPDELDLDAGATSTLRLRASWSLDRLVFNPDELRAARANLDWLDWQDRRLARITDLYVELQELLATARDAWSRGECDLALEVIEARIEGLRAHLFALTGLEV